jgi:UDP-galactopyranose mutase
LFEYIIAGAGFAGSVMAERIATELDKKVLVIEKRRHFGGNCYDCRDNETNIIVHKYGPHLFHTDNGKVFRYLSNFTEWDVYHHRVLAFIDGKNVPIPFNVNSLYELFPANLAARFEKKILESFPYNTKVPILELKQTTDPDLKFLADYIYEKIFVNYTAKQWGLKPEELEGPVTARVPVFIGRDDRYFHDRYQAAPRYGYNELFTKMLSHPNIKLMLNTDFREIVKLTEKGFEAMGRKFSGKIIYTGMIDELFDYRFGELNYRSINMCFETKKYECFQETPVVNYPNNYDFTRITEFKHIHPVQSAKTVILKEYPVDYKRNENIPYYPFFTPDSRKKYEKYKEYARRWANLILLGRLAEYRYYDMDDIVERALLTCEEKII